MNVLEKNQLVAIASSIVMFLFLFFPTTVFSRTEKASSTDMYLTIKYSALKDTLYIYNHSKLISRFDLHGLDFNLGEFIEDLEKKFENGEIIFVDEFNHPLDKRRIIRDYKKNYERIQKQSLGKTLREQEGNKNPKKPQIDSATIDGVMANNGGSYVLNKEKALSLSFSADDQDAGDTVTIITPSAPTVGTFTAAAAANPGTATFTFTPDSSHVGMTYTFSLRAQDNNNAQSVPDLDISIEVNSPPNTPSISSATIAGVNAGTDSAGIYSITDGQEIVLNFSASDSNSSDTVTLSTPTSPTVGTFTASTAANPGTATYTFQPLIDHVNRRFEFTVRSTDNRNGVSTSNLSISVRVNPSSLASNLIQAGNESLQQEAQALIEAQLEAEHKKAIEEATKQTEESLELEGVEEKNKGENVTEEVIDTLPTDKPPEEEIENPTAPIDISFPDMSMSKEPNKNKEDTTINVDEILKGIDKIKEIKGTEFATPKTNNVAYAGSPISFVVPNQLFGGLTLADLVATPCHVIIIDSKGKEYLMKVLSSLPNNRANSVIIKGEIVPKEIAPGIGILIVTVNSNPVARLGIQIVNNLALENIESTQPPEIQTVEVEKKNKVIKFKISGSNFSNKNTTVSVIPSNGLIQKEITVIKGNIIVAIYQIQDKDVGGVVTIGVTNPYGQAFHPVLIPGGNW